MAEESNDIDGNFVVAVVTRDHAEVWRARPGEKEPVARVLRPEYRSEDTHVRQAQAQHGHFVLEGVPDYFGELATVLRGATEIVVVGHGSGKADFAEAFVKHARENHPAVFSRITGTLHDDVSRLTPGQVIAHVREWKDRQTLH